MPQAVQRDLADDGDGRGVDELRGVLPDEGRPQHDPAGAVDDQLGSALVALRVQRRTRDVPERVLDAAHRRTGCPGLLLGEADCGDLRVGEHDLRHGSGVGGRDVTTPGGDVLGGSAGTRRDERADRPALVLALMGQQHPPVDVARGIEPAAVDALHLHRVVDGDAAAGREPDSGQAEVGGGRRASGRDEQLVGLDGRAVREGRGDRPAIERALDPLDADPGPDLHAGAFEAGPDELADERLGAGEQPLAPFEHGHLLAAQRRPRLRHLHGHDAATHDEQPPGRRRGRRRLAAGPRARRAQPREVGDQRARAGRQHHGVPGGQRGGRAVALHLDGPLADEPTVSADQRDAGAVEPGDLPAVVEAGDEAVPVGQHGSDVEPTGDGLAGARDPPGCRERVHGPQQGLAGDAGPVRALAADQLALHDRDAHAALAGVVGDVLADGTGSEHDDVVCLLLRGHSTLRRAASTSGSWKA